AEAIVAMLAVLKTGAAYLPIDPALPDVRIPFMLTDAGPIAGISTARAGRAAPRVWARGHRGRRPRHRHPARHRVAGAGPRGHRLPHLHLGHHRGPEGGGRQPPQPDPLGRVNARPPARGAGVDAVPL